MKNKNSLAVLLLGISLGFGIAQLAPHGKAAQEIRVTGESGNLKNFDVLSKGETVCADPFVSVKRQTIECE